MTNIKLDSHEGFVRITLDNGVICLALLPQLGGKIISLVRVDSGREYLGSLHDRQRDRKSTRLNSSHQIISYAVFCLKKKKKIINRNTTAFDGARVS